MTAIPAKEIGGYLELERFRGQSFHHGAVELNSARSCLAYLIELRDIWSIAKPDYMCDAVGATCRKAGVQTKTYHIGEDFAPVYDFELSDNEYLYLADFFGFLNGDQVAEALAFSEGRLIVDEVQGFFRTPWEGADTIYTCRKFFGVADGAYLYTKDNARLAYELPIGRSYAKMTHILGRFEQNGSVFYADAQANEKAIGEEPVSTMSPLTRNILLAIDYDDVKIRRVRNYQILKDLMDSTNLLDTRLPEGPFMYPCCLGDAEGVREKLASESIYIPTLWPNILDECKEGSVAFRYARNVLPLPIDQRYEAGDMERVAKLVRKH